jgi:hypothetical protein
LALPNLKQLFYLRVTWLRKKPVHLGEKSQALHARCKFTNLQWKLFVLPLLVLIIVTSMSPFAHSQGKLSGHSWKLYEDKERGFRLEFPSGSRIETRTPDYVRIQNYVSNGNYELKNGQYYLELFFGNRSLSCKSRMLASPMSIQAGSAKALIGKGVQDGDPGGMRFVFCTTRNNFSFEAVATENHIQGPIANRILRSIKFSD